MKIITLALGLIFFVLAFMIIGGSFSLFNANAKSVNDSMNVDCVKISFGLTSILYDETIKELSFTVMHQHQFSNEPVLGISVRGEDESSMQEVLFNMPIDNGASKKIKVNATISNDVFFVSALGCPSDFEKRCYVSKGECN